MSLAARGVFGLTVVLLLSLAGPAGAQAPPRPCDQEAAVKRGGWVQAPDAGAGPGMHPLTRQHRQPIAAIIDGLAAQVRKALPDPVGSQGKLYRDLGERDVGAGPRDAAYGLTVNFKGYGCNRAGAITQHTETATWLHIQVNGFSSFTPNFEYAQSFLSPREPLGLYTIPPPKVLRTPSPRDADRKRIDAALPPAIEALPNFTHEGAYDSWPVSYNTREVLQIVFITPDGGIPYDPVSIGEFLDINERLLQAQVASADGGSDRARALLARIGALRARYAGQLHDAAFIRSRSWSESELQSEEPFVGRGSGYQLSRRSDRYRSTTNNYQPRFIVVAWRWQPEVPYSVHVHEAIKGRLDVAALAALIADTPRR